MTRSDRLYLYISLGLHLCLVLLLFLSKGPRVADVIPRRVLIEFRETSEPLVTPSRAESLPELSPQEMAESLQLQGPKTLAIPAAPPAAQSRLPELGAAPQRLGSARSEAPLLPEPALAAPELPADLLLQELTAEAVTEEMTRQRPAAEDGISEPVALEWSGRERQLLKAAAVGFPDILLEEGLEAVVVAQFKVGETGQVTEVDIIRGSGYASVDALVSRALYGYLFEPSPGSGEDVGQVRFRFRLERGD